MAPSVSHGNGARGNPDPLDVQQLVDEGHTLDSAWRLRHQNLEPKPFRKVRSFWARLRRYFR